MKEKIYSIKTSEIAQVQGSFEYIGEIFGKAFVKSKSKLNAPFSEDSVPAELQEKIDAPLKNAKEAKIDELNKSCDDALKDFESSALGSPYIYDGDLEDQINIIGAINLGVPFYFRCRKEDGAKENLLHTAEQLKKVFADGVKYKSDILHKCAILKAKVESAQSIEEAQSISFGDEVELPSAESESAKSKK